jgi:hypothetical protein
VSRNRRHEDASGARDRPSSTNIHRPINAAFDSPWPRVFSVKTRAVEPRTRPVDETRSARIDRTSHVSQAREESARHRLFVFSPPPFLEFVGESSAPPGRVADSSAPAGCAGARRGPSRNARGTVASRGRGRALHGARVAEPAAASRRPSDASAEPPTNCANVEPSTAGRRATNGPRPPRGFEARFL